MPVRRRPTTLPALSLGVVHGPRRRHRVVLGACVAIGALALAAPTSTRASTGAAPAPDQGTAVDADDVLGVAQVLGSSVDVGDHVVLRITVAADRLVDGEVRVTNGISPLAVRQPVQVAGGSTEELLLAVPVTDPGSATFEVRLFDGGDEVDVDTIRFRYDGGTDVAGVMPVLLARAGEPPARVTLDGDLRRVDVVPVTLDLFDLGPSGLSQLDTLLATSDDLTALPPTGRVALSSWIDRGGRLVLDDADDLSALPSEWQPGDAGYAFAGRGEVHIAEGVLTAGEWDRAIAPAPLSPYESGMMFSGLDMLIDPRVTLAQRAGVELPDLDRIVIVLGAYVLLVGPVLYLVLRRMRRLTAAWVAIPAIALVVAGGVVFTSSGWNTAARSTSATIVESHPGGSHLSYQQLLSSRSGGTTSFSVPAGWMPLDQDQFGWWGGSTGSSPRSAIVGAGGGTTLEATLEPGQVAVLEAEGADDASLLVVDAAIGDDGTIRGTVTNTAGVDLVSVGVFGGGRGVLVGDIAAGASADYEIDDAFAVPDPFDTPLRTVWNDPRFGLGFDAAPTPGLDAGVWTWFASKSDAELYPVGQVRAAGWSPDIASPGDDTGRTDNLTLVTAIAPIANDASSLMPQVVRWTRLETAFDPRTGEPGTPVFRFAIPPDAPIDDLVLELERGINGVEVLDARGRWTDLGDDDDDTREESVEVPASAVRNGALIVRTKLDLGANIDLNLVRPVLTGGAP